MRRINYAPSLLLGIQLSGFAQSLPVAWLPMVCLMHYWSSDDLCWPRLLKMSLGNDSLRVLAARKISLLMLAAPGEDAAAIACKGFLGYAYFFMCCSRFVSVTCIWLLLSALTKELRPSLV